MIDHIVHFISAHAFWAGPLVFIVAFVEALAVVGSFVPGSTILVAVGTSAGAAHIAVTPLVVWAAVGAFAGDALSYAMGRRHGSRILAMRPFAFKPEWSRRAQDMLQRRGDLAIFGGRLFPPVRALMPLLAGMSRLSPWRFVAADGLACAVWATLHLEFGDLIGHALEPGGFLHVWFHQLFG